MRKLTGEELSALPRGAMFVLVDEGTGKITSLGEKKFSLLGGLPAGVREKLTAQFDRASDFLGWSAHEVELVRVHWLYVKQNEDKTYCVSDPGYRYRLLKNPAEVQEAINNRREMWRIA